MRKIISAFLAIALFFGFLPGTAYASPQGNMSHFTLSKVYESGMFNDVASGAWYENGVATAFSLGLIKGDNNGNYAPTDSLTILGAVTLAARVHRIYTAGKDDFIQGNPWYQVYIDYAVSHGIIRAGEFGNYNSPASRTQMAHIFARALPEAELPAINTVNRLPDVNGATEYYSDILLLYRAGVLTGNDSAGTFDPNGTFTRAQAATVIARMALPQLRETLDFSHQEAELSDAITPLAATRGIPGIDEIAAVDGVEPYSEHYSAWNNIISADLSNAPELAYSLTFSDMTHFSDPPAGYDPEELLEWGKDPGLNVDILHKYGFTGKGAVIAYVDQAISNHKEFAGLNLHYTNNRGGSDSMHGPAVLSLLAGKDTGTAPGAEVYYYAHASWEADQTTHAECLYQIIEQNKTLPNGEKITMVGFSDNIDDHEKNAQAFREAVAACEKAGIMVWFCGEYAPASYLPMSDKNNPENLTYSNWWNPYSDPVLVYVPDSGRTTATNTAGAEYIYWSVGGLSWTMPYVLGLYAIVNEIDPSLTQDELRELLVDTAYINNAGMRIINPVGFVAAALKRVGRTSEANAMLNDVSARNKYVYAVMDPDTLSAADKTAIKQYLSSITGATVLLVDAGEFKSAEELYAALQKDANARGGITAGVQIFGTPNMVPAFQVQYTAQMPTALDKGGTYLTDLFYGNFNNDAAVISNGYNVAQHFSEDWNVDLVPEWPVVRLPLKKGEYRAFFEKYTKFARDTGLERQDIVNFSNPIFASKYHTDDMGAFLNRMNWEFSLLDSEYRLYGNLDGQYPVTTKVLGGFTQKNLEQENDAGVMELLINSHGQWNNIDQCVFENGKEVRISFLNMNSINTVLDGNPYYLDCWTCSNGYGMADNLSTTALNGQCVGIFSATAIISNNGVNCNASLTQMEASNFYYFYYSYLKALDEGFGRSMAFSAAQTAYAEALMKDSENGIRNGEGNYQFNLNNLLVYHNFGVLEPNFAEQSYVEAEKEPEKPAVQRPGKLSEAVDLLQAVRSAEAQSILDSANVRSNYLYAVMDTAAMTKEDLTAVGNYLASITWANVLIVDAASFADAETLYAELQADSIARGGTVAGVQIFGTASMVPSFHVLYKLDTGILPSTVSYFFTDYFYGNFDNDADVIANEYSVYHHFEENWNVDLIPDWPVARLPLEQGEYTTFFEKYDNFVMDTGLEQQTLVNFSMPITMGNNDDMGAFLNQMDSRYGLLDVEYRLYGNQKGTSVVSTQVLGGISTENMEAENDRGIMELLINTHGSPESIEEYYRTEGGEYHGTLISVSTINSVLDGNYYYLDLHTCSNGGGMANNFTTTALNGQCVGVFSATEQMWVNGIDWCGTLPNMEKSDLRYFYYCYLKSLHDGKSRSQSFYAAQEAFAEALVKDSRYGIREEANYQYHLYNLLVYHNFGVMEPDVGTADFGSIGQINQTDRRVEKDSQLKVVVQDRRFLHTDGNPVGDPVAVEWEQDESFGTLHSYTVQALDNGYLRFTAVVTLPEDGRVSVFDPPNGNMVLMYESFASGELQTISFDLPQKIVTNKKMIVLKLYNPENEFEKRCFYIAQFDNLYIDANGHVAVN